jgi:hypothetical protein
MNEKPENRCWVKSHWRAIQLSDKTVEFRCTSIDYGPIKGNGKFDVLERPGGEISVSICLDEPGKNEAERVVTEFYLPQSGVDAVKQNPPGSQFEFSCFPPP